MHYFEWNIAIRPHYDGDFSGKEHPYRVIKNSWRYWCADPFIIDHGGKTYVFFEAFDRIKSKGLIGYREITNGKISKIRICLETEHHLSYPYLYERNGDIYMLPESFESKKLVFYKAVSFPDKWQEHELILDDVAVCDSVLVRHDSTEFLLTMPLHGVPYVYDELDMYVKRENTWEKHPDSPMICDTSHARCAGDIFKHNGMYIRPSQDCSVSYGEAVVLSKITQLDENGYAEEPFCKLTISDMNYTGKKKFDGIHTLNISKTYDTIDLRISSKLQLQRMPSLIKSHFKKGR